LATNPRDNVQPKTKQERKPKFTSITRVSTSRPRHGTAPAAARLLLNASARSVTRMGVHRRTARQGRPAGPNKRPAVVIINDLDRHQAGKRILTPPELVDDQQDRSGAIPFRETYRDARWRASMTNSIGQGRTDVKSVECLDLDVRRADGNSRSVRGAIPPSRIDAGQAALAQLRRGERAPS